MIFALLGIILLAVVIYYNMMTFKPSGIELHGEIVEIEYKVYRGNQEDAHYYPIVRFEYNGEQYELRTHGYYTPKDCPSPGEFVRFTVNKKFTKVMILNLIVPNESDAL